MNRGGAQFSAVLFLCFLGGCGCPELRRSIEAYQAGMDLRTSHPSRSESAFVRAREQSAAALQECELKPVERVAVASVRIRACIETQDYAAADEAIAQQAAVFEKLDLSGRYAGDVAAIALLKAARHLRAGAPDLAIAEYVAAEEHVTGARVRGFMDLRKVDALLAKAAAHQAEKTADAKQRAQRALGSAIATCDAQQAGGSFDTAFKAARAEAAARLESLRKE